MSLLLASPLALSAGFLAGSNVPKRAPAQASAPYYPGLFTQSEVGSTGLPGDVGFDPLGLANFDLNIDSATDKQRSAALVMRDYRDAELKHGRLAMLCAVAFPLQEKLNPYFAAKFHLPNLVAETGGLSPSVLNGGLEQSWVASSVVVFATLMALVEAQGLRIKKSDAEEWVPGDFGTLRIAEPGTEQFYSLAEGEIWNGRIAMLAVLGYVLEEVLTKVPTAATIPFF